VQWEGSREAVKCTGQHPLGLSIIVPGLVALGLLAPGGERKTPAGGVNGHFQAKLALGLYQNLRVFKTTGSISAKICRTIRLNKTLLGWSHHASNESKMADYVQRFDPFR